MSGWRTQVEKNSLETEGSLSVTAFSASTVIAKNQGSKEIVAELGPQDGLLSPPYDPRALCLMAEQSNALGENVDAYKTNIDGWGNRFVPAVDFEADDIDEQISDALFADRMDRTGAREIQELQQLEPSEEDVERALKVVKLGAKAELAKLNSWFSSCCIDIDFVELRRQTRVDLEITGNAYWEVLRDLSGRPSKLLRVSAVSMRLTPMHPQVVRVNEAVRVSSVTWRESSVVPRRFRRFAQINDMGPQTWFKEFGDPRTMSRKTGKLYASEAKMRDEEDDETAVVATEVIHFRIHSPRSAYGVPRWVGRILSVLGSRAMEEVNLSYFNNKSVPPLAVLVGGGARLNDGSVERIENFIKENVRGRENFWSILVLQAEPGKGRDGRAPDIKIEPLTKAQLDDATHQAYDANNAEKVGRSFRLPKLLRGDAKDFNRATAEASLRFAEDQVFAPERGAFDSWMNRTLMPALGARFWSFQSLTRMPRDPERLAEMIRDLAKVGVLTPEEARVLAGDVFNTKLSKISESWVKRPIALTLAGVQTSQMSPDEKRNVAMKIRDLRHALMTDYEVTEMDAYRDYLSEPVYQDHMDPKNG